MKKLMIAVVAAAAMIGIAFGAPETEKGTETLEQESGNWNNWRLTIGGFGRGNMRAKIPGMGSERVTAYGVDLDLQYNVWQNRNFNLWAGIGGTFCPRQKMSDSFGKTTSQSEHQDYPGSYATYDFYYTETSRADVELGYGEFRMMMVPEWKVTDSFALGARVGVAFDWINTKCSYRNNWAWNSVFDINIPGMIHDVDYDGDRGGSSASDTRTEFAAQAILGLQATYMFTDWVGLYANFDWRLGGETDFDMGNAGKVTVDMSGWYWGAGVVVSF